MMAWWSLTFFRWDDLSGVHGDGGVRGDVPLFLHHFHQPRQIPAMSSVR